MVYWADGETSHKLATAWNDGAIAAHKANPDRFVVLVEFPLTVDPLIQMPSGVHFSFFASAFVFGEADLPLSQIPFADFVTRADCGAYRLWLGSSRRRRRGWAWATWPT